MVCTGANWIALFHSIAEMWPMVRNHQKMLAVPNGVCEVTAIDGVKLYQISRFKNVCTTIPLLPPPYSTDSCTTPTLNRAGILGDSLV